MWTPGMHRSIWLRVCYVEAWYALICLVMLPSRQHNQTDQCIPGVHITDTYQRITQSLIRHCIRFACKSAGTEELPDDATHVSKHVGAAEQKNNELLKISAFVGYL
jgi:hypothetical protein